MRVEPLMARFKHGMHGTGSRPHMSGAVALQSDNEDALKDEGEEALRLQRQAAEALRPEDFEQGSEPDSSEDEDEAQAATLGAAAARVGSTSSLFRKPLSNPVEPHVGTHADCMSMSV